MNDCCMLSANREDGPGPRGMDGLGEPRADVVITHCVVCESRHLEAEADLGEMGVAGVEL